VNLLLFRELSQRLGFVGKFSDDPSVVGAHSINSVIRVSLLAEAQAVELSALWIDIHSW
jgi:hypothetical protein